MLVTGISTLALAQPASSKRPQPRTFEGEFGPLKRSVRGYAKFGPAGPFYPQRASEAGASGFGLIKCDLAAGGEPSGCKLVGETPRDSNFAPAARIMAERKRIYVTGAAPGETILVRVPFVLSAPATIEP